MVTSTEMEGPGMPASGTISKNKEYILKNAPIFWGIFFIYKSYLWKNLKIDLKCIEPFRSFTLTGLI